MESIPLVLKLTLPYCTPQDVCWLSIANNMTKEVVEDAIFDWPGYLHDSGAAIQCYYCNQLASFVYECNSCGEQACQDCEGQHMHCEVNDTNTCYKCITYYHY